MRRARKIWAGVAAGALTIAVAAVAWAGDYGWQLTAYGSAHSNLTGNHFMTERQDGYGNWNGHILDLWLPWFCRVDAIHSGDGVGTTMRIQIVPPAGSGVGCRPGYDNSQAYGWSTGTGWYEGWHSTTGYTSRRVFYISGRNPASPDAYGTEIEVY